MSDSSAAASPARFACQACGKSYKWKPELADRKVKCSCGHVMRAPATAPTAPDPEDDLIPLADETPEAPARQPRAAIAIDSHDHTVHGEQILAATAMGAPAIAHAPKPKPRATVRVPQGVVPGAKSTYPKADKRTLAYAGPGAPVGAARSREDLENELGGSVRRQLLVPGALVVAGFAIQLILQSYTLTRPGAGGAPPIQAVLIYVTIDLIFRAIVTTGAVFLAAKLFDVGFGGLAPTVLKIAAIALLSGVPMALILTITRFGGLYGMAFGVLVYYATCVILFKLLFELDFEDANYCGIAATLVNFLIGFMTTMFLLSRFM